VDAKQLAIATARARIAIGISAMVAPGAASRTMFEVPGSGTRLFARMLAGRDLALGLGVVIALDRGAPVRGWLEASALADGVDFLGAMLSRREVRPQLLPGLAAVAGGASLLNIWLSRQLDPPPAADPGHPEAIATGHPAV
jgi:hypothetical protein